MILKRAIILLLLIIASCSILHAQEPFVIDSGFLQESADSGFYVLNKIARFRLLPDSSLTWKRAWADSSAPNFPDYESFREKLMNQTGWIRFSLLNRTALPVSCYLMIISARTTLFEIRNGALWQEQRTGYAYPVSQWDLRKANPAYDDPFTFHIMVPPHSQLDYLARIGPQVYIENDIGSTYLMSEPFFQKIQEPYWKNQQVTQSFLIGMILMIFLFSLLTFFSNRDLTYLFYSLYIAGIAIYFLQLQQFDRLWLLDPDAGYTLLINNLSVYSLGIFYPLYTLYFFRDFKWNRRIKKFIYFFIWFAVVSAAISSLYIGFSGPPDFTTASAMQFLFIPTGILGFALFLLINIIFIRSRYPPARFFAIAGFSLFIGMLIPFLQSLFHVTGMENSSWTKTLFNIKGDVILEIACIIQILFFALALSYRSRMIEKAKTELEVMDTTKARFFANISHEFKTPLTLILGPAAELAKKTTDLAIRNTLHLIEKNARRLLNLINEIMDLAKLDAGRMELHCHPDDLVKYVRTQVLLFSSLAESKKIRLEFHSSLPSLPMAFDADKLQKVMANLLSNACKFTPENGSVTVQLEEMKKQDRSFAQVSVIDTGSGIRPEQLPHLFDRFYQADSKSYTTDQPGTGIGLALTRDLVELHEGGIEVRSELDKGTEFQFWIPTDLPAPAGTAESVSESGELVSPVPLEEQAGIPAQEEAGDSDQPELLLIEDNEDLRHYIRSCLSNQYLVREAADGEEGLSKALKWIPDLVITDVMMPRKDGFEVSRALKQDERTNHIPVIILTGKSSRQSRLEGLETEADVYLAKPFDADELRLQVSNQLRNRERMREHFSRKLFLETSKIEVNSLEEQFLQKAIKVVEENMTDEDFSVEQLSSLVFMDRTQLFRKLKALTGENPSNFIRNLRLKKARYMLEHNAGTVSDIAFAVGFGSTTYFNKCYKDLYGESPGKTRIN